MLEKYIYNADLENTTSTKEQLAKEAINRKVKRVKFFIEWYYECPVVYNKFQIIRPLLYWRY